jgi:hypothetical protein
MFYRNIMVIYAIMSCFSSRIIEYLQCGFCIALEYLIDISLIGCQAYSVENVIDPIEDLIQFAIERERFPKGK